MRCVATPTSGFLLSEKTQSLPVRDLLLSNDMTDTLSAEAEKISHGGLELTSYKMSADDGHGSLDVGMADLSTLQSLSSRNASPSK